MKLSRVAIATLLAAAVPPGALAQTVGGYSAPASGGVSSPSIATPSNGWPPRDWPPSLGSAANAVNSDRGDTQRRATAGSGTVSSANADAVARSGDFGAATRIGENQTSSSSRGTTGTPFVSIAGTGPESLYNIPRPVVNVDLEGIRRAIRIGPNGTPDRYGN